MHCAAGYASRNSRCRSRAISRPFARDSILNVQELDSAVGSDRPLRSHLRKPEPHHPARDCASAARFKIAR